MAAGTRPKPEPRIIALQLGSELRITESGDIRLDNPTIEVENAAADAVISWYRDPDTGDHVIRLVDPFARRTR